MTRVWRLLGHRRGDNRQIEAFTARLGAAVTLKQLHFGLESRTGKLQRDGDHLGIAVDPATPIEPPWPDMVVAVGYRSAPMALAIRDAAGGRPKLAIVDNALFVPQRAYGDVHRALAARGLLDDLAGRAARSRAERIAEIAAWEATAVARTRTLLDDEPARRTAS